eukprot:1854185-Alexandrium_andersonii.AAC.1
MHANREAGAPNMGTQAALQAYAAPQTGRLAARTMSNAADCGQAGAKALTSDRPPRPLNRKTNRP